MNFYEYCELKNLDISMLSRSSKAALGGMYLENVNPTQEEIDRLAKIDTGIITPKEALEQTFTLARSFAQS